MDKEKKKTPQFLYFHSHKANNEEGEDIGFEDNNQTRDAQTRVHAKLLDSLL
jgi:hypothetical protein